MGASWVQLTVVVGGENWEYETRTDDAMHWIRQLGIPKYISLQCQPWKSANRASTPAGLLLLPPAGRRMPGWAGREERGGPPKTGQA